MLIALLISCKAEESPSPEGPLSPVGCVVPTEEDILTRRGDYYRCLDEVLMDGAGCGPDGYPLGYGAKYADRYFDEVYPSVSSEAQAFLRRVSIHLQREMDAFVTPSSSCEAVWDYGFGTHPACYIESGFCDLELSDVAAIAGAVDPEDQDLPEAAEQTERIVEGCQG